ncbi:hypothetical protein [Dactylosporangium sp. NPDC049140]|uniref:hypothetical protein n=1 Tax=Dactylosporangium sp. NPDC049140 TaxID=3155647 RepID=UPI0033E7E13A
MRPLCKGICAAAATLVNNAYVDTLTKQFGALITARQTKNAIQDQAGTWSHRLGGLQPLAADPAAAYGARHAGHGAHDTLGGGFAGRCPPFEDAARVAGPLADAVDSLQKACA